MVIGKSPEWLPSGFTEKVKYKNGRRIKVYTEVSSGKRFYSRVSVTRYLGTEDRANTMTVQTKSDNAFEQSPHMSLQCLSMTNTDGGGTPEEKTKGNSFQMLDKVDEPSPTCVPVTKTGGIPEEVSKDKSVKTLDKVGESSPKCLSMTNTCGIPEKENKNNSIKKLDKVDKPSPKCISMTNTGGTLEEEKKDNSVKMLDKVNDPSPHLPMKNTGAISVEKKKGTSFKPVAIVSTAADDLPPGWIKEIVTSKCGIKTRKDPYYTDPVSGYVFRSKLDALRYVKTNDFLSCAIRPKKRESTDLDLFKNEIPSPSLAHEKLPKQNGQLFVDAESNGCGANSESEARISNQIVNNNDSDIVKVTETNPESENGASIDKPMVTMDIDAAISIPLVPEETSAKTKNPRKRKTPSVPSRTLKRLSRIEPETQPDSILSEHSLRAAEETKVEPLNEVDVSEPPKEALSEYTFVEKETPKEFEGQPKEVVKNPPNDENPLVIPEEQIFNNNNDDENKQESSQLCFDFGDTWSVPLDFALKTLRGDISIDDTLAAFPGCYNENLTIPFNNGNPLDGCVRPSQSDVPDIFRNEVDGMSKQQQSGVNPLTGSSSTSFSDLGDFGFSGYSGFNNHSSNDVGKNDGQTKFNP